MIGLELTDVGVRYGARRALDGITTPEMRGGEVVAVIGPNAAGKSTLLRAVAGLVPHTGRVRTRAGSGKVARTCYLPQDTAVNAVLSVYESILLAAKRDRSWRVDDEVLAEVDAVLRLLDLEPLASRNLDALSGGQRQLVSLAQILARTPDVMLLDEPTSALDLRRQYEVIALVRHVARERGIVALASIHDLSQALRLADRVLVLAEGRLAAFGAPREVVTPRLLFEIYGVRARVEEFDTGLLHVLVT